LEQVEGQLGEQHPGELRRESAHAKAERILGEERQRLGWEETELKARAKGDPAKLAIAVRLRRETTLTVKELGQRLHMGSWKSLHNKLCPSRKTATSPARRMEK
jgi:hypothetical protein